MNIRKRLTPASSPTWVMDSAKTSAKTGSNGLTKEAYRSPVKCTSHRAKITLTLALEGSVAVQVSRIVVMAKKKLQSFRLER